MQCTWNRCRTNWKVVPIQPRCSIVFQARQPHFRAQTLVLVAGKFIGDGLLDSLRRPMTQTPERGLQLLATCSVPWAAQASDLAIFPIDDSHNIGIVMPRLHGWRELEFICGALWSGLH